MAYNLWVDGLRDADRFARLFNKQQRSREPLSGIVDGVNQYYYTQLTPVLTSGSIALYTSGSVPLSSSTDYTLDEQSGLFTLTTAPSVQPSASYQTARYSDTTMRSILIAGFDEMELQWFRGFALSNTLGTLTLVDETSGSAFITDSSGSAVKIGNTPFENSRAQIGFYVKCVQLAYLKSLLPESALSNYIWAESGGLRVDKSMVSKNLKAALDTLEADLAKAKISAQLEWYGDAVFGGAIAVAYSPDFVAHRWWQKDSIANDTRDNQAYIGDRW